MMIIDEIFQLEDTFQIPTYKKIPIALTRGEGPYVWDTEGNKYLDFYGGHCVTMLGHCPPKVVQAIQQQAAELMFYSNVCYSPVRARAARELALMSPPGLRHVFFCNSGTEANETALKLARKWTGRNGIIAMEGGFHGRTLGSLAVTAGLNYRSSYINILPETHFVPFGNADAVENLLHTNDDIAAVILEPIQSMAGITEAKDQYFTDLRSLCDQFGVALIFDEVQTGVGRTGTFSISEQFGLTPDLVTMAKSLGSGIPVGATLTSSKIAESVKSGDQGCTFGGGMLAMTAVTATLETIREEHLMECAPVIFSTIKQTLQPKGIEVRGRGCLIGLLLDKPARDVLPQLRKAGILAGSAADPNVIRLMPPLNTPQAVLQEFLDAFLKTILI